MNSLIVHAVVALIFTSTSGYESCRNTYFESRIVTGMAFLWFAVRWWHNRGNINAIGKSGICTCLNDLVSTFILEVCGGAGALWGVSEVAGPSGQSLRTGWGDAHFGQPSFDFWRVWAGLVFVACFARWWVLRIQGVGSVYGSAVSPKAAPHKLSRDHGESDPESPPPAISLIAGKVQGTMV